MEHTEVTEEIVPQQRDEDKTQVLSPKKRDVGAEEASVAKQAHAPTAPQSDTAPVVPESVSQWPFISVNLLEKLMGDSQEARRVQEQCRQLSFSVFFDRQAPVRSLGFTSAIAGEGKSFLSLVTAMALAKESVDPVTLVECNWEHPSLHGAFSVPVAPGLAEWLRDECDEEDIRYKVAPNLTFIPAGFGEDGELKLLRQVQRHGLLQLLGGPDELLVVDLPPIVTSGYGPLAAALLDALLVVVHAGTTPNAMVAAASAQLGEMPVRGVILNQSWSRIPRWLQQIL